MENQNSPLLKASVGQQKILVTGAGGFIGHHLVRYLKKRGYWVRGVDIKEPEYSSKDEADEFLLLDLRYYENCLKATEGADEVYALAADMGGMMFITFHTSDILYNNVCINANTAEAAKQNKYFLLLQPVYIRALNKKQ